MRDGARDSENLHAAEALGSTGKRSASLEGGAFDTGRHAKPDRRAR